MTETFDLEDFITKTQKSFRDRDKLSRSLRIDLGDDLFDALNEKEFIHDGSTAICRITYRHRLLIISSNADNSSYSIRIGGVEKARDSREAIAKERIKEEIGLALGDIRDEAQNESN